MGLGFINRVIPAQLQKNLIAYYRLDGDAIDVYGNNAISYNPLWVEEMNFGENWKNNGSLSSYIVADWTYGKLDEFSISFFLKKNAG